MHMYDYPDGPESCDNDSECTRVIRNWYDTGPLIVYVFWSVCVLILVAWCAYRRKWLNDREHLRSSSINRRGSRVSSGSDGDDFKMEDPKLKSQNIGSSYGSIDAESLEEATEYHGGEMLVEGYVGCIPGQIAMMAIIGISLMFFGIWICLNVDRYWECQFTSVDAQCLYGSHPLFGTSHVNMNYFFVVWWFQVLWFAPLVWFKSKLLNWCPCTSKLQHDRS